jgi:peptidoglycan/xylan/chitin deacetylase (PgdA/CDA1 family)
MSISKFVTKAVSPAISFPGLFESASKNLLLTFNYHEINDNPSQFCTDFNLNVRPEIFAKQLVWIKKYFNVIGPQQLISGDFELPAALITFDDGFEGVFNQGAKILKEAGIPAVVFMNMAPVRGQTCWSGLVTYLCEYDDAFKQHISLKYNRSIQPDFFLYCTRDDVQEFLDVNGDNVLATASAYHGKFVSEKDLVSSAKDGLYLGNHLFNHYNAASLSSHDLTEQYLLNESAILEFSNYIPLFSYPFGQPQRCYNRGTDEILASLGARRLFTAFPLFNRDRHARRIHRTAMFEHVNSESIFRAHCLVPACMNHLLRNNMISKSG